MGKTLKKVRTLLGSGKQTSQGFPVLDEVWALHPSAAPLKSGEGVDVIACHGIQPRAGQKPHIRTWVDKKNKWSWLQHGLPRALGEATTNVLSLKLHMPVLDAADDFTVRDLASQLKMLLPFDLGDTGVDFPGLGKDGRRVVAVGHSLGGIVLKAWLLPLVAVDQNVAVLPPLPAPAPQQPSVEDAFLSGVKAIIFIAVPHRGAASAKLLSRLPWSSTWLDILGKRGNLKDVLGNLETGFDALLKQYNISVLSMYETKKTKKFGLKHKIVEEESATVHSGKESPKAARADHCGAAALVKDSLPYLAALKFVGESLRTPATCASMVNGSPPLSTPSCRLITSTQESPGQVAENVMDNVTFPVTDFASAHHSVVLTLIFNDPNQLTIETAPQLAEEISKACTGDWTLDVTVPGAGSLHFENGVQQQQDNVFPVVAEASLLILESSSPDGNLIEGPAFLLVRGQELSGALMYAHVGGIYIQLSKSTLSLKSANMEWLEQVDGCHVFDVEEQHLSNPSMLIEACQGSAWSAPLEVPLLQSQSDDMDETFAALSPDIREQALEGMASILEGCYEPSKHGGRVGIADDTGTQTPSGLVKALYASNDLPPTAANTEVNQELGKKLDVVVASIKAHDRPLMRRWVEDIEPLSDLLEAWTNAFRDPQRAYHAFRCSPVEGEGSNEDVNQARRSIMHFWNDIMREQGLDSIRNINFDLLQRGQNWRRKFEMLDIANYYRCKLWTGYVEGQGHYLESDNRPEVYVKLEQLEQLAPPNCRPAKSTAFARQEQAAIQGAKSALAQLLQAARDWKAAPQQDILQAAAQCALQAVQACTLPVTERCLRLVLLDYNLDPQLPGQMQQPAQSSLPTAVERIIDQFWDPRCENESPSKDGKGIAARC